jgi:hypothetical protein
MQPTYLPWLGYFDLMDQVDTFVLLDSVQFARRSWQQRNRIKTRDGVRWLTVPVRSKGHRDQRISEVRIDPTTPFADAHLETIRHAYSRAAAYDAYADALATLMGRPHERLVDVNVALLEWLRTTLGIATPLVRSSTLNAHGEREGLLVEICRALGATRYVSPQGARVYLESTTVFPDAGIELCYQGYQHPEYRQLHGAFASHLSAIDALMNEGARSLDIIRSGRAAAEVVS